jgi:tyrosine-protein kinase Etk/Wzc
MSQLNKSINPEENELKKIIDLVLRNYKFFIISVVVLLGLAFLINKFSTPIYRINSSLLIKEESENRGGGDMNNFLKSNLFGVNQNFQNELFVLKSSPVIEQTIENLDLAVGYFYKEGFNYLDAYESAPFRVIYAKSHVQPINVRFNVIFQSGGRIQIRAKSDKASIYNFESNELAYQKENWIFQKEGIFGELIETPDLSFILQRDNNFQIKSKDAASFYFEFKDVPSLSSSLKNSIEYTVPNKLATVIEISLKAESIKKGKDIVNELMDVYSKQNLDRKNHNAMITIDYIEKQLNEVSESLSQTEDNLQSFRSSNQLLNITEQATGISAQYMNLQNQQAELVTRKRYYDYVSDYLSKNDDFSNMIVPASMGIPDQLLNSLMSELITAQAQRSNLIANKQERNPLVQKLDIQIENIKKTISENITSVQRTTELSIDEMNKRIRKVEAEINRLPKTQRQLGGIERKYRLNDAIYNYLLEKRAEAKITMASNVPDDIIIEPAKMVGLTPVSPNTMANYMLALLLGLFVPFGYIMAKSILSNKIEILEDVEKAADVPILGKIMHSSGKSDNIVFEFPRSNIAESYRMLRTNLDHTFKGLPKKVILMTSSIEGEGKTFNALNLAMSYAQLDRKVVLVDFDLRKVSNYFGESGESLVGLSSYLSDRIRLEDIILKSPDNRMDYIPSGPIPPNPVELLDNDKTGQLIEELKNSYDIVILDTTPLAQVTDAYLLFDYADIKVIIARYNYTIKKVFTHIMKDLKQKNIDNVCIVMNDNRIYRDQYGYGYGYGYNKKGK